MPFYIPTYDGKYTLEGLAQAIESLHAEMLALYQGNTAPAPLDTTRQIAPSIVDARHAPVPPLTDEQKENLARSLSEVRVQEQTSPVDAGGEDAEQHIINKLCLLTGRTGDLAHLANTIAAIRARLADAERRADEMEGKAGEWIAADVHKERVESARADAVAMNKRLLGERDAAWKENARMLARVAELELRDVELVKSAQNAQAMVLKLNNTTLADLAAERERREAADQARDTWFLHHSGTAMERDAARAEVAALKQEIAQGECEAEKHLGNRAKGLLMCDAVQEVAALKARKVAWTPETCRIVIERTTSLVEFIEQRDGPDGAVTMPVHDVVILRDLARAAGVEVDS